MGIPLSTLRDSFELSLRAENKAPRTVEVYILAVNQLAATLPKGTDSNAEKVSREDIRRWLESMRERGASDATISVRYRALRQFWKWAIREGEIDVDPMLDMTAPKVTVKPVPVVSDEAITALLKACQGKDYGDVRDTAAIRLLLDTGIRRAELVGLTMPDVDLKDRTVTVLGKGRRLRTVRFGHKTAQALDRYLRARSRRPAGQRTDAFWLSARDDRPWRADGVRIMLRRRSDQAGLDANVRPHMFRHTFASDYLGSGGNESDLMRIAGWRSRQMVDRYGAAVADERARDARDRLQLKGDRL